MLKNKLIGNTFFEKSTDRKPNSMYVCLRLNNVSLKYVDIFYTTWKTMFSL